MSKYHQMLTLYPLQFGAPKGHGQVEGDEVFVVTHGHEEIELHLRQHLWQTKQARVCRLHTDMQILCQLSRPSLRSLKLLEGSGSGTDLLFKCICWIWPLDVALCSLV